MSIADKLSGGEIENPIVGTIIAVANEHALVESCLRTCLGGKFAAIVAFETEVCHASEDSDVREVSRCAMEDNERNVA
jgi:hypothetical protein